MVSVSATCRKQSAKQFLISHTTYGFSILLCLISKAVYFKRHIRSSIADPIDETFGPTALGLANKYLFTKEKPCSGIGERHVCM
jgi:hypothetical protein